MLLLAYLITASDRWRDARVKVLTVVEDPATQDATAATIDGVLKAARLDGSPRVLVRNKRTIPSIMREESKMADLAILGVGLPDAEDPADPFFRRIDMMLSELPTTIVVHSARNFEGEPVLFDSEEPAV